MFIRAGMTTTLSALVVALLVTSTAGVSGAGAVDLSDGQEAKGIVDNLSAWRVPGAHPEAFEAQPGYVRGNNKMGHRRHPARAEQQRGRQRALWEPEHDCCVQDKCIHEDGPCVPRTHDGSCPEWSSDHVCKEMETKSPSGSKTKAPSGSRTKAPRGSKTKAPGSKPSKPSKTRSPGASKTKSPAGGRPSKTKSPSGGSKAKTKSPAGSASKTKSPGSKSSKTKSPSGGSSSKKTKSPSGGSSKTKSPSGGSSSRTKAPAGSKPSKTKSPTGSKTKAPSASGIHPPSCSKHRCSAPPIDDWSRYPECCEDHVCYLKNPSKTSGKCRPQCVAEEHAKCTPGDDVDPNDPYIKYGPCCDGLTCVAKEGKQRQKRKNRELGSNNGWKQYGKCVANVW